MPLSRVLAQLCATAIVFLGGCAVTDPSEPDVVQLAQAMVRDVDAAVADLPVDYLITRQITGPFACGESRRAPAARVASGMFVGGALDSDAGTANNVLAIATQVFEDLGLDVVLDSRPEGSVMQLDAIAPGRRHRLRLVVADNFGSFTLEGDSACGPLPEDVEGLSQLMQPFAERVDPHGERFEGRTR